MRRLFSFLLGGVMLFGAATLGLQTSTANAKDRYHKHRHHRHHHRHYHRNKLSY